ncbi:DUF3794 and LysM peptidoglycan-binding domain-containing protein [Thermobrachium celere]|uniref:DUF3794 and LysM peptidoglycan-binding domain-containing protein n=1 Tax=Thermobrachium celere TaxID=53422 RepID=UPI0019455542|nr:SPOCS domain-containing protein [Thermobrachium celere]GFR35378.1 peptidase M23 [Thermobrachium celere]
MSLELIRDMLSYERIISEGSSQTMVSGDIVIDEMNPEIDKILSVDGEVTSVETTVLEDKVLVDGRMSFKILYASRGERAVVKIQKADTNFKHYVQAPMAAPNMVCKVVPSIETLEYEIVSDKKLKVNAVVVLKAVVFEKCQVETIVDIKGQDLQSLKDTMKVCEFVSDDTSKVIVKGNLELPQEKGEFANILKLSAHVHKKDILIQDGKLVVNACVLSRVLFETTNNVLMSQDVDIAFTNEVMIEKLKPNMKCDVSFRITDVDYKVLENEAGAKQNLEIQISLDVNVKTYNERTIERTVDAFTSTSRFEFIRDNINSIGYYGEGVDSQTIKERITIDDELEGIRDIVYVDAKPILTEVKIVEDKVVCDGVLDVCAVYRAEKEEEELVSYREEIPFKAAVSIDGAKIDMIEDAVVNLEYLSFDKASQREIDIKAIVEVVAKLYNKMGFDIVKNIEEIDIEDSLKNMPSLVLYVVQPKDTLWKIAKKYCTSVDDIVKLNDIENPDLIMPGMKLLIPKKGFMK